MPNPSRQTIENKLKRICEEGTPKPITINGTKKYINNEMIERLKREKEKEGGFLPALIAAIPAIAAALTGVGAVAGGASAIANAVSGDKRKEQEIAEQKRHNKKMEGKGFIDHIKNFVQTLGLEQEGKKAVKNVLRKLAEHIEITKDGNGLHLGPYPKQQ